MTKQDWRLTNQEQYLRGVALTWCAYEPANPENDHDHCEFCLAKFMVEALPDTQQEGYATDNRYRWICRSCFDDFAIQFAWKVENAA